VTLSVHSRRISGLSVYIYATVAVACYTRWAEKLDPFKKFEIRNL